MSLQVLQGERGVVKKINDVYIPWLKEKQRIKEG